MAIRIKRPVGAASSGKAKVLEDLTVAIARAKPAAIAEHLDEDARWHQIGRQPVTGVQAICKVIERYGAASSVTIEHVICRGQSGAVDGTAVLGGKERAFCHVFDFAGAKGNRIDRFTTYLIRTPD